MKDILCFFGNIGGFFKRYSQYPDEKDHIYPEDGSCVFRRVFKMISCSAINRHKKEKEQLWIHRENDLLYYAYVHKLDNHRYIGIGVISDKICAKYDELYQFFNSVVRKMADTNQNNQELIIKRKQGKLITTGERFIDRHVDLDLFIKRFDKDIKNCFMNASKPPVQNRNTRTIKDIVFCSLKYISSNWIEERIQEGYNDLSILSSEHPYAFIDGSVKNFVMSSDERESGSTKSIKSFREFPSIREMIIGFWELLKLIWSYIYIIGSYIYIIGVVFCIIYFVFNTIYSAYNKYYMSPDGRTHTINEQQIDDKQHVLPINNKTSSTDTAITFSKDSSFEKDLVHINSMKEESVQRKKSKEEIQIPKNRDLEYIDLAKMYLDRKDYKNADKFANMALRKPNQRVDAQTIISILEASGYYDDK